MDYKAIGEKAALHTIESLILLFTPDNIIKMVDELVRVVDSEDMKGEDKFWHVVKKVQPHFIRLFKGVLMFLVQMSVDSYRAGKPGLIDG